MGCRDRARAGHKLACTRSQRLSRSIAHQRPATVPRAAFSASAHQRSTGASRKPCARARRGIAPVGEAVHDELGVLSSRAASRSAPASARDSSGRRRRRQGPADGLFLRRAQRRHAGPGSRRTRRSRRRRRYTRQVLKHRRAPAPIVRWPTSELPICPSGNPTARPLAGKLRVRIGSGGGGGSITGVSASAIALPGSGRRDGPGFEDHKAYERHGSSGGPGRSSQISSGTISIAPHGHSAAQIPQPLQ